MTVIRICLCMPLDWCMYLSVYLLTGILYVSTYLLTGIYTYLCIRYTWHVVTERLLLVNIAQSGPASFYVVALRAFLALF